MPSKEEPATRDLQLPNQAFINSIFRKSIFPFSEFETHQFPHIFKSPSLVFQDKGGHCWKKFYFFEIFVVFPISPKVKTMKIRVHGCVPNHSAKDGGDGERHFVKWLYKNAF